MNEEIKRIVEDAIAPLKKKIAKLDERVTLLLAFCSPPPLVSEASKVINLLPQGILDAIDVQNVSVDPLKVWFRLELKNGTSISVKKNETDFRVRHRDKNGELLKELTPSFNGLALALKSLA